MEQDDEGGTENNIPYDREFTKLNFVHLAIVDNPRYERANIVFNSNYNPNQKRDEKGKWTKEDYNTEIDKILKGELKSANRIKVVEHPSDPWLNAGLQDAEIFMSVKTYSKATTDKHNVSEETMRKLPDLIDDPLYIFKSSTVPGSFVGILDDFEEENGIKKPLIAVVKPEHGKIDVNLIPSVYGKDPDFPYREVFKNNLIYERPENNKTVSNNIVASIATETLKRSNTIITDIQENFNSTGENMLNNVFNGWITKFDKDGEPYHVEIEGYNENDAKKYIGKIFKSGNKEYTVEKYDKERNWFSTIPVGDENRKNITRYYYSPKDLEKAFEISEKNKKFEENLKKEQLKQTDITEKHLKAAQKVLEEMVRKEYEIKKQRLNNTKEQNMTLLHELKKLITNVENDKGQGENMDENEKVDNEKIDKRKLIDEVGGILKDKVDEEVWRTVIGKLEKLSYDKSETGAADNKKEDPEPKEDEVKNKKVKNESEDDREKVKEIKEEVKKDVDNKCKNSVENSKIDYFAKLNSIYNASTEPPKQDEYVSKADRLAEGNRF